MNNSLSSVYCYPEQHKHHTLHKERIQITPTVYTFVGYSISNISIILGNDGYILVDTGSSLAGATEVLEEINTLTSAPLKAIFLTHSHPDHLGGGSAFLAALAQPVAVWARSNFGAEQAAMHGLRASVMLRGGRQFGKDLPDALYLDNAIVPSRVRHQAPGPAIAPDHFITEPQQTLSIAGITLMCLAAPSETPDHMAIWLPDQHVLFAADAASRAFPNLSPIRGAAYRDAHAWVATLKSLHAMQPTALVMGHDKPAIGKEATQLLADHHDALQFVLSETMEGIEDGRSPDDIATSIRLPEHLRNAAHLGEFYTAIPWAVRSIYAGLLGWFDGNPSQLAPLPPKMEAERMAALAGGVQPLFTKAQESVKAGDYQWALRLADVLILLGKHTDTYPQALLLKAEALEGLSRFLLPFAAKNYLVSCALELRKQTTE